MPIRSRLIAALALCLSSMPLVAATGLEQFDESRSDPAEWTIAVYLDADNDLEKFGLLDMNEMELGLGGDVNLIVLIDRAEGYDDSDGNWTDARVYRIARDEDKSILRSPVIARPGEVNMGDPAVLEAFLATTLKSFPAKRTALLLWNHGGGWQAHAVDHGLPGEPHATDSLTLPQLSTAISGALGASGHETLDLTGFDMCLMAQYEVALELQGLTDVLVASQATEPGDGWPYDRVLPAFADVRATTAGLAAQIVEQFDGYYREREEAITTLAAYDLAHLPTFSERFDRLLAKLEPALPELWPLVSRSIFFAEGYAPRTELQKSSDALASIDLVDAFRRMELNARGFPARGELRALEQALDKLLITHKTSPSRRLSNGIAIYAPVTAAVLNEAYDELAINTASRWRHFIGQLHGLQAAGSKAPAIRDLQLVDWKAERPVQEALPLNTHGVRYVVEGDDLLWLRGLQGQWDDKGEGLLVSHRASIVDANWSVRARDTAADRIDLMIPQFSNGANSLVTRLDGYRYLVYGGEKAYYATIDESGDHILVPILFHHPEAGDLGGTIYFHPQWWYAVAVELELPQPDGSVVYRQIKPEPGHEITLLFEYLKKDGTRSHVAGKRIAWGGGPELLLGLQEPGLQVFGVTAEAIGGKTSHALFEYRMGEDPGLKAFMQQGSAFELEDLLGTWEMIEPEALAGNGAIVPNGVLVEYARHPEKQALMISTMTAPQRNAAFRARELVYLDRRMVPHLRSFKMDTEGLPEDPLSVEFSVNLVALYMQDGRPVMLTRNTVSGLNYAFAKVGQAAAGGPSAAPPPGGPEIADSPAGFGPPQTAAAPTPAMLTLDGVWQRQDGVILIVQGEQFQVNQYGLSIDAGMFAIQGDVLMTRSSYTGALEQYRFALEANVLRLQDGYGGLYVYQRLQ
ncbi:MAG TPA: clostripain-related cysteine peptidase [Woeseiaceae bacterium]|nr:clostripain-related cysteine peptidase [Woeseiaceae bacterium]